ncbi:MAG: hypothetical protein H7Y09_07055, partial [Chitinophagaceae bacterium]|nr:hypothetical protein [Anaerolineae bacterium]
MNGFTLTAQDTYVLGRFLVGLPHTDVECSAAVCLLIEHLDPHQAEDVRFLRKVLGHERLRQILAIDPTAAPPERPDRTPRLNIVPDLPDSAKLTTQQIAQAADTGHWLNDYVAWAGSAANET